MNDIKYVDIVFGISWGDEGKGKITSHSTVAPRKSSRSG